ncbi:MAG: hypothetical protein WCZ87_03740 [Thiohalobacteraceae bacterium]
MEHSEIQAADLLPVGRIQPRSGASGNYVLHIPSFPRMRESSGLKPMDSRIRGNDGKMDALPALPALPELPDTPLRG